MALTYRELPPPSGLGRYLACVWVSHDRPVRVLPDGCIDLVRSGDRLVVAGPATTCVNAAATPGQPRFGVRFRIGAAGAALGLPVSELLDQSVPITDVWGVSGKRLEDRVLAAGEAPSALPKLIAGLAERLIPAEDRDRIVREAALRLVRGAQLGAVIRVVGLSERQLRRRFESAVGYGPATLVRIQRFQRFLALAEDDDASLARIAADSGYADQAHLTRECRRLSGLSPAALLVEGATAAGETSVLFKRDAGAGDKLAA